MYVVSREKISEIRLAGELEGTVLKALLFLCSQGETLECSEQ